MARWRYPATGPVSRDVTGATPRSATGVRQEPKPMWRPSSGRPISMYAIFSAGMPT